MSSPQPPARQRRAQGAFWVVLLGLGILLLSFFRTQVVRSTPYGLQAEGNRLRPLTVAAPRGTIFDRNGEIVAENVPAYVLSLLPNHPDSLRATLERLAGVLELDERAVADVLAAAAAAPGRPVVVSSELDFDAVSAIEERRHLLPGVSIETRPERRYARGAALGHLVGYIAEVDPSEDVPPGIAGYEPSRWVGRAGLEREYEERLGGEPGVRYVEVDARGRVVGAFAAQREVPPVPGRDLRLHLDLGLQRWIGRAFPDGRRGAVVALEPGTGHVLALFSRPGYDPNAFVGGPDAEAWQALRADPDRPLQHRAVSELYGPGSTFKLATAAIALELGLAHPDELLPIPCRGGLEYGGRYFRCVDRNGHGSLAMGEAILRSCNVYFYQLGIRIGLERFLAEASRLGFGRRTGIDLPVEEAGIFPATPDAYRRRLGTAPAPAEVLRLAIGEGPNAQSALRLTHFYAALAADGHAPTPRLARDAASDPAGGLRLGETVARALREGLRGVTAPGAGAHEAALEHWELLGKSGAVRAGTDVDHGWFVGMAGRPGGEPEIVVGAVVEGGARGGEPAQIVAKAADYYLRKKHGLPITAIQTLRDHWNAGRPASWAP